MSIPLIPENAPFNASQRAWLNGFFAGLGGSAAAGGDAAARRAAEQGAESSQPEAEADAMAEVDDADLPWHDPALPMDERMEMVADKPLNLKLMGAMAQLDCGSCGYMCRSYSQAIADGSEADLNRCVPGGKQTARQLKKIMKESGGEAGSGGDSTTSAAAATTSNGQVTEAGDPAPAVYDRSHPFPAPTLAVEKLTGDQSEKDVRFISLSIAGSGIEYKVGDSLGVFPKNCYENVDALVRLTGYGGAETVTLSDGRQTNYRDALITYCDIDNPSDELYEMLNERTSSEKDRKHLSEVLEGKPVDGLLDEPRVIDVLARFRSATPDPQAIVSSLDRLQPRLYSIASSPARYPDEIHLAVGVVRYVMDGHPRKGVASTFLAERLLLREPVSIFLQPSHGFGLPGDDDADVIMVGPGTGIAPFRAFLQEREATNAAGRNWLFFGDQHQATDFLFKDELERFRDTDVLTRLTTAFSRDQEQKLYVQHRMLEYGQELWRWLESGASFYVCGDASRMAADVDQALHQIVAEHGRMSADDAAGYIKQLAAEGRYQRDVY